MKNKLSEILKNGTGVFWASAVAAIVALVKAFGLLFQIDMSVEFLTYLSTFLLAIVTVLVTVGLLPKGSSEDAIDFDASKELEKAKQENKDK